MQSMTGFGHAERSTQEMDLAVDIKTVNGRFLDVVARLPKELAAFETALRKEVQSRLSRGRVEVFVNLTLKTSGQLELNESLVHNYLGLVDRLRSMGLEGEARLTDLLDLPGVLIPSAPEVSSERTLQTFLDAAWEALDKVLSVRQAEGEILKIDLKTRLGHLAEITGKIAEGSRQMTDYYREKLWKRVRELTQDQGVDENRLFQEVLHYSERSDISEEITRLRSHIERFRRYLEQTEEGQVGKNLDFLCQEMNREMNTILSKSALAELVEIAVEGKAEIEKMREQVQNVE